MSQQQTGQTEMRSVLFTDLVGSTELRVRVGEEVADHLRRTHDHLLSEAVTAHGGEVVKGMGDGILATFVSAADAVGSAVAIQQAVDLHGRRFPDQAFAVRVGVSVGDVSLEASDVFGVAVVEASRLCASANGGEILVAELVRTLCRGRPGFQFESFGELDLKGLPEPLPTCRLFWEPAEDVAVGARIPLRFPPLLAATSPYVGRVQLLDQLEDSYSQSSRAGCRMTLLAGEPGVGKTRTAAELAHRAHATGAVVLYGRCDEDLGVPYQPFMEALDFYTEECREPVLGRLSGELVRLLPELSERRPDLGRPIASDPRSEEHLLFEATASWLVQLAGSGPTVVVLDDLHWADKPTLQLLQHVLRVAMAAGEKCQLLVLGTYRDTDIDRTHPLAGVLADLRRLPVVDRRPVSGLSASEVEQFIAAAAGHELDDQSKALAEAVYAETEGNPFFVAEVLRHLVETGAVVRRDGRWSLSDPGSLSVPEGVRDVIGRRLSRLSASANELLSVAAVIGRDIEVELVAEVSDLSEGSLLDGLDEAVRARIIDETGPDHYRFSHALIRATLYEELSATRRRRLHRRVAESLEKLRPDDVVALAFHYVEAGPEGGLLTRAVRYSLLAAELSLAARALADAERRFRQVLEVLDEAGLGDDDATRLAACCGLGECQRDQGDPQSRQTLLDVARRAVAAGEVGLLVRAVLGNTRGFGVIGALDTERVEITRVALEAVGPEPGIERAKILALLASELVFEHDLLPEALAVAEEAEQMARSLGDADLLAHVLVRTGFCGVSLDRVDAMVARGEEATRLADRTGDPALRALARYHWSAALLAAGDFPRFRSLTEEAVALAADASPSVRWAMQTTAIRLLLLDGRLEEAAARNDECLVIGQSLGEQDASSWWAALFTSIAWTSGDAAWLADQMGTFAEHFSGLLIWRSAHVAVLAMAGRHDEARAVLDQFGIVPEDLLREPFPATGGIQLSFAAYFGRDPELAAAVYRSLLPYRRYWAHFYLVAYSPVSWGLALCAQAMGDLELAVELYEEADHALEEAGAAGHRPLVDSFFASLLVERGAPGDFDRAYALIGRSTQGAVEIGAPNLVRSNAELLAKLQGLIDAQTPDGP